MPTRIRVLLASLTVAALAIFVLAYRANSRPETNSTCNQPAAIDLLYPQCNTQAFQQAQVGVDMAAGYTVDLSINGEPIPLDQIENRRAANEVDARIVPDLFIFTPGPGKAVERLKAGPNIVTVSYRKVGTDESTTTRFSWSFTVS